MSNLKPKIDDKNHKTIFKSNEKITKWLNSLPVVFEKESDVPEHAMLNPRCGNENNVTTSAVDLTTVENTENKIQTMWMNYSNYLTITNVLKLISLNKMMGKRQKCQNQIQLKNNEVSTDKLSVYI